LGFDFFVVILLPLGYSDMIFTLRLAI